jgi:hypothetical protein
LGALIAISLMAAYGSCSRLATNPHLILVTFDLNGTYYGSGRMPEPMFLSSKHVECVQEKRFDIRNNITCDI